MSHIIVIGMMGSGKSVLGRRLAARRGMPHTDIDALIERDHRQTIATIFAEHGEPYFRKLEARTISDALSSAPTPGVFALGGGAFEHADTRAVCADHQTVWLDVPAELLWQRVARDARRPLMRNTSKEDFLARLAGRTLNYQQAAFRLAVDPDWNLPTTLNALDALLRNHV